MSVFISIVNSAVHCPSLTALSLPGRIRGGTFSFPNTVELECGEGYWLKPSQKVIKCNELGKWVPPPQSCEKIQCLQHFTNVITDQKQSLAYGEKLSFYCNRGYLLSRKDNLRTKDIDIQRVESTCTFSPINAVTAMGEFIPSPDEYLCKPVTCQDPKPPGSNVFLFYNDSSAVVGSIAVYACKDRFKMNGNPLRFCMEDGQWSDSIPTCTGKNVEKRFRNQSHKNFRNLNHFIPFFFFLSKNHCS